MNRDKIINKYLSFPKKIALVSFALTLVFAAVFSASFSRLLFVFPFYTAIVLFTTTVFGFYYKSKSKQNEKAKYWPLFGLIIGAVYGFVVWRFSSILFGFIDLHSKTSLALLFSLFVAVISYIAAESVEFFSRKILLFITVVFFLTGFTTAVSFTKDHYWWRSSICSLGMPFNGSPFYYNFTMIMTGLLFTLFFIYLRTDLVKLVNKGLLTRTQIRLSALNYFVVILLIILVGALPYGYGPLSNSIHVRAAQLVYVFFGVFIFFIQQLMPIFSKKFDFFSYLILGSGLFLYVLFNPFAFFSMATFELITIGMMAFWFYEFLRNVNLLKQ